MKEQKSIKAFIKRHGVEIVLGASCIACGVVGYRLASKAVTEELMKEGFLGDLTKAQTQQIQQVQEKQITEVK